MFFSAKVISVKGDIQRSTGNGMVRIQPMQPHRNPLSQEPSAGLDAHQSQSVKVRIFQQLVRQPIDNSLEQGRCNQDMTIHAAKIGHKKRGDIVSPFSFF
jgi:hypothetical protein